jgi:hypothetical protein
VVVDQAGGLIKQAQVELSAPSTGFDRSTLTDADGRFAFDALRPGIYDVRASMPNFKSVVYTGFKLDLGATLDLRIELPVAAPQELVEVEGNAPVIDTQSATVTEVIDQRAIEELPLNGRRFSDLALLTPGVTQDPRGLTSASNGDLAFGGVRGFQTTFLVDGSDNNNGFFSQARGRYRAPYQFSNEVVQEFRVSSNTASAEFGRSSGAIINVVTKSGTNSTHGSIFYYLRDGNLAATHPFVRRKFADKQHQFGASVGGPLKRGKLFYFAGFDQHIYDVPLLVNFEGGGSEIIPAPADYEVTDQALVFAAADDLSQEAGEFRTELKGNAGFIKLDANLTPRNHLAVRLNISRFWGDNNVFFDDSSPLTTRGIRNNGEELVATESMHVAWTGVIGNQWSSNFRGQFSRDDQSSRANTADVNTLINGIIGGLGRASILPRETDEKRLHIAEIASYQGRRHTIKFGGDLTFTRTRNYFPLLFGGEYTFDDIRVNPFTFVPQTFGLAITPLRAYAHEVPNFYEQRFGRATSHPHSSEYSLFVQDTMRLGDHLALSLGLRYDLQTFGTDRLQSNPLWPESGKLPSDHNNFAPRVGIAASFGPNDRPFVVRGGFGMFYTRIPQIYASAVELDNGLNRQFLNLDNADFFQRQVFPVYPDPLVSCPAAAETCAAPASVAGFLTTEISSFRDNYQTPSVVQSNLSLEKEILRRTAIGASYLYVAGKHLIRARDANLPAPIELEYPVFDDNDDFTGEFFPVQSFSTWQFAPSLECPAFFAPCINSLQRPISNVGAINVFDTAASSIYHGLTLSAKRRMTDGIYLRFAYTWAHAMDTGPDALLIGGSQVQTTNDPVAEKARSVTDQRHRAVFAFTAEPRPFGREHRVLRRIFNDWKFAGVFSGGSGRPLTGRINRDLNRDGNFNNDRLPHARRNSFTGPNYISGEVRVTRKFHITEQWRLEASLESFNVFNRNNKRIRPSDEGFSTLAAEFIPFRTPTMVNGTFLPGYVTPVSGFLEPDNAYNPRQVQIALRLRF